MAAIQLHKPVEKETATVHRKTTTTETTYNKANSEHSFGNKMKEMANSATKLFHHGQNDHQPNHLLNKQHHEAAGYKAQQTGTGISSNTTHATQIIQPKKKKENLMTACTGKKKKEKVTFAAAGKKEEKHGGGGSGFLASMEEHVKLFAHKADIGGGRKKKKSKGHGGSKSSDDSSSSSDESDNDGRGARKK